MLVPKHTMEPSLGWKYRETLAVLRVASDHPWTLPLPILEKMVLSSLSLTVRWAFLESPGTQPL